MRSGRLSEAILYKLFRHKTFTFGWTFFCCVSVLNNIRTECPVRNSKVDIGKSEQKNSRKFYNNDRNVMDILTL